MREFMTLANGYEVTLQPGASIGNIEITSANKQDMVMTWDQMTEENLKTVTIKNDTDVLIGEYKDLVLVNETSTINRDGSIKTSFYLREKTDIEKDITDLKAGQVVQDGAIADLGEATSALATK